MTSHVVFDQETLQATAAFGYSELDMSVGVHGGSDSTNTDIRLLKTRSDAEAIRIPGNS
jgi:hypothetical protein